jgi:hypothetical protein
VLSSEPSVRDLLWRGLNPLGRAATILMFLLAAWTLLSLILPWEPLKVILTRRSSVGHYVASVVLLMIDVPLAWAAWKTLESDRGRRALVAVFICIMFLMLLEARFALEKGERWHPRTLLMVLYSLLFIQLGLGRKRPFPPGIPVSESSRTGIGL